MREPGRAASASGGGLFNSPFFSARSDRRPRKKNGRKFVFETRVLTRALAPLRVRSLFAALRNPRPRSHRGPEKEGIAMRGRQVETRFENQGTNLRPPRRSAAVSSLALAFRDPHPSFFFPLTLFSPSLSLLLPPPPPPPPPLPSQPSRLSPASRTLATASSPSRTRRRLRTR